MAERRRDEIKVLARNRRARHEYVVEETLEAGIELRGSEVKSVRDSQVSMAEAWAQVKEGQVWLLGLQINEYPQATIWNHAPKRDRRLLLHRKEIAKLAAATERKGYTLIPLEIYLNDRGLVKLLLGVCRGKDQGDKREAAKERDANREVERALAARRR